MIDHFLEVYNVLMVRKQRLKKTKKVNNNVLSLKTLKDIYPRLN